MNNPPAPSTTGPPPPDSIPVVSSPALINPPPPTASANSPWWTLQPIPAHTQPLTRYTFNTSSLSALFSPAPTSSWFAAPASTDTFGLQWLGVSLLQTFASILLTTTNPTLSTSELNDLRQALVSRQFHAHLSRTLGLPEKPGDADKARAATFESYMGAVVRDVSPPNLNEIYPWYSDLVSPYLPHFSDLYQHHRQNPPAPSSVISNESKARRQGVAVYTSRLMEYAAKNKLEPPTFEFVDNGEKGPEIVWRCTVSLGGKEVARAQAGTKGEAKHLCSREALNALGIKLEEVQAMPAQGMRDRRMKKEFKRRMAAHAAAGGAPHGFGGRGGAPMGGAPIQGGPMPGGPMPGGPMPGGPMPRGPMPGAPMPGAPMPGGPVGAVPFGFPPGQVFPPQGYGYPPPPPPPQQQQHMGAPPGFRM